MFSIYIFLQHFWSDVLFGLPFCIVEWWLPFSCSTKINFQLLDQTLYLHHFPFKFFPFEHHETLRQLIDCYTKSLPPYLHVDNQKLFEPSLIVLRLTCDSKHVKVDFGKMADCLLPFTRSTQMK